MDRKDMESKQDGSTKISEDIFLSNFQDNKVSPRSCDGRKFWVMNGDTWCKLEKEKELDWPIVDHIQGTTKEITLQWNYDVDDETNVNEQPNLKYEKEVTLIEDAVMKTAAVNDDHSMMKKNAASCNPIADTDETQYTYCCIVIDNHMLCSMVLGACIWLLVLRIGSMAMMAYDANITQEITRCPLVIMMAVVPTILCIIIGSVKCNFKPKQGFAAEKKGTITKSGSVRGPDVAPSMPKTSVKNRHQSLEKDTPRKGNVGGVPWSTTSIFGSNSMMKFIVWVFSLLFSGMLLQFLAPDT